MFSLQELLTRKEEIRNRRNVTCSAIRREKIKIKYAYKTKIYTEKIDKRVCTVKVLYTVKVL